VTPPIIISCQGVYAPANSPNVRSLDTHALQTVPTERDETALHMHTRAQWGATCTLLRLTMTHNIVRTQRTEPVADASPPLTPPPLAQARRARPKPFPPCPHRPPPPPTPTIPATIASPRDPPRSSASTVLLHDAVHHRRLGDEEGRLRSRQGRRESGLARVHLRQCRSAVRTQGAGSARERAIGAGGARYEAKRAALHGRRAETLLVSSGRFYYIVEGARWPTFGT
jgi:hypothetical protein